jgi:imidazolonepropionase-like amidohydrolase
MRLLTIAACLAAFTVASAQQAPVRAFTGGTLYDGSDRPAIPNATILVRNGRIASVGSAEAVAIPSDAEVVLLHGKYVMPGLVNTHGHVNGPADLGTYAAYGVTTVYSLGGEPESVFAARAAQNVPTLNRSRVYLAGPVLAPRDAADARTQVADAARQKVDIVKIRVDDNLGTAQKMTPEVYRAVITAAHERDLRVASHLYYLDDAKGLLAAGTDFVAHSVRDRDVDDQFVTALKASGKCYTPTLMREVSTYVYESTPEFFTDPLFLLRADTALLRTLRDPTRQAGVRANVQAQRYKAGLPLAMKNLKRLVDAGIPVSLGTDTGPTGRFQGYFELMELDLMARSGMTPRQILTASTSGAAKCMQLDREVGTIEAGKWADLLVLDRDPLADIANVRSISSVWVAGNRIAR